MSANTKVESSWFEWKKSCHDSELPLASA